ncbi:hypothetical protein MNB_SM-4-1475 [hydrothermal vent metagenome]|uniref:Uncharacterized protein n=1 Tax=hydrothermal vent metagenome TaxID=652676 RepID=A0A1W1BNJ0_9ZZZZ
MKNIILIAVIAIVTLSGCGGGESSSSTVPETQTSVLVNSAKSTNVINENQVKTNTGYTHLSASGSRYSFE